MTARASKGGGGVVEEREGEEELLMLGPDQLLRYIHFFIFIVA